MSRRNLIILSMVLSLAANAEAKATDCPDLTEEQKRKLVSTHVYGGAISPDKLYIRRGYVLAYDETYRVPKWVAWRAEPSYRDTPKREGKWKSFRKDPDVPNGVVNTEYNGLYASSDNFARGHLIPYYISGGDRDGDGEDADVGEGVEDAAINDLDDACTVFEINYMSNIAPQYHNRFNGFNNDGPDGLWYQLETKIRGMIDDGNSFNIIAGTIFGDADVQLVGNSSDNKPDNIGVPHMFFKVVIGEGGLVPFLFVHQKRVSPYGCELTEKLEDCIVTLEQLEAASGYDFFSVMSHQPSSTWSAWTAP